jgi:hypothetical protein
MLMQLDLRVEAGNLRRFHANFADGGWLGDRIRFPRPIDEMCTRDLLVETYIHGRPVTAYEGCDLSTRVAISRLGVQAILKMIFLDNFLHMDLHPGNVLVCDGGGDGGGGGGDAPLGLAFLDAGMAAQLTAREHVKMTRMLGAIFAFDGHTAARYMVVTPSTRGEPTARFVQHEAEEAEEAARAGVGAEGEVGSAQPGEESEDGAYTETIGAFSEGIQSICEKGRYDPHFMDHINDYLARMSRLAYSYQIQVDASPRPHPTSGATRPAPPPPPPRPTP